LEKELDSLFNTYYSNILQVTEMGIKLQEKKSHGGQNLKTQDCWGLKLKCLPLPSHEANYYI
jgi:hypothetical protein